MGNDEQNLSKDGINVTEADVEHCRQERLERRIRFKNNHLKNFQESSTHTHTRALHSQLHTLFHLQCHFQQTAQHLEYSSSALTGQCGSRNGTIYNVHTHV